MNEAEVDARGLRCPWPVLRLARALRTHAAVTIRADDPAAPREIAAAAAAAGWSIENGDDCLIVRRADAKNCFTSAS